MEKKPDAKSSPTPEQIEQASQRRHQAQLAGERKYANPWPCAEGHTLRYASNSKCCACQIKMALKRYHVSRTK